MPLDADVVVRRGGFTLEAALDASDGETVAVLGPNGAGKSTLVEAIAGLVPLHEGRIELDGAPIHGLPPSRRRVGLAFQDGLLFPRLTVLENVAFPLRARGVRAAEARRRAGEQLERLASGVAADVRPAVLSGGQRQKVALARALIGAPRLLLLDEPLAAVDVAARGELRALLRREVAAFDGPCLLVAHDPVDALTLADRVVILEAGGVVQAGRTDEIRRSPRTAYTADLVGVNLFAGTLLPTDEGAGTVRTAEGEITVAWPDGLERRSTSDVLATLQPADVSLHLERPEGSPRNVLRGRVEEIAIHGERARVRIASRPALSAEITRGSVGRLALVPGAEVYASFKAVEVDVRVEGAGTDTLGT